MKLQQKVLSLGAILLLSSASVFAQNLNESNLTTSPYTRYGFGKLGNVGNVSTQGMGNLGIGLRTSRFTNLANPASYTAIDTLTMLFDMGLNADLTSFKEDGVRSKDWDGGFSYMSFHFPLWNNFAMAVALTPYSMVGYNYGYSEKYPINSSITNKDTLSYTNSYEGRGGLNKIMGGIGWKAFSTPKAELNVGLNAGFIFGSVSHNGSVTISSGQGQSTIVTREYTARGFDLQLGLQYTQKLSPDQSLILGATFSPNTHIGIESSNMKYSSSDTIEFDSDASLQAPLKFGFGATYVKERKLIVGAEFSLENWSNVAGLNTNLEKDNDIYKNIYNFAVGLEYQPALYSRNYFKTAKYRCGLNYKTSYIDVYGSQNSEYTLTAGIGLPVNRRSMINFAIDYTRIQPSKSGMLSEDYLGFSLGITFNELMFFRNKLK